VVVGGAGPPSSVQLSTPYLDERVRLGKGSRGSLFVFTRGGPADQAGQCLTMAVEAAHLSHGVLARLSGRFIFGCTCWQAHHQWALGVFHCSVAQHVVLLMDNIPGACNSSRQFLARLQGSQSVAQISTRYSSRCIAIDS
jgi:hypothetical protein